MASFIDMYFRFPATGYEYRVPVIPAEINIGDGSDWQRIPVLGLGEVALPSYRKPQEISFSSFFPYQYDSSYCQYANLLHPADAQGLFNTAMGHDEVPPQIVHFIIIEEYQPGVWTTWVDDEFAIESFQKKHKAGTLVDLDYSIVLRSVKTAQLRATSALADNIGTQKPHPVRTGGPDAVIPVSPGLTGARATRVTGPLNYQLQGGVSPDDVDVAVDFFDPTQPLGGSKYSYTSPGGGKFGADSSAELTVNDGNGGNGLGEYVTTIDYTGSQIIRDEYLNNGGTLTLITGSHGER